MDAVLNKLKEFKKIIYFCVCGLFVFLLLCDFILNVDNKVGAATVIADLFQDLFHGALLAAGLYGLLKGKDAFCRVAFALLLGSGLYNLVVGVFNGMWAFQYFNGAPASYVLYYVFLFITGLFGTAFAVLVVLGWMLGREDLRKYGGYCGIGYVAMSVLMIVFSIVLVADDRAAWTTIINAIYAVFLRAFYVVLATSGTLAYEETEAPVAASPAEKETTEEPAEKTEE